MQQNLLTQEKDLRLHAQGLFPCAVASRSATAGSARTCRRPSACRSARTPKPRGAPRRRRARRPSRAKLAGERYGLHALARSIEDDPKNTTRFLVLGRLEPAPTGRDRTSLVMSAENKPGAVHALLTPLAEHKVSMTRIESRPSRRQQRRLALGVRVLRRPRRPRAATPAVARALEALQGACAFPQDPGFLSGGRELIHAHGSLRAVPFLRALDRALPARQADLRAGARARPRRGGHHQARLQREPARHRPAHAARRSTRRSAMSRAIRTATASS